MPCTYAYVPCTCVHVHLSVHFRLPVVPAHVCVHSSHAHACAQPPHAHGCAPSSHAHAYAFAPCPYACLCMLSTHQAALHAAVAEGKAKAASPAICIYICIYICICICIYICIYICIDGTARGCGGGHGQGGGDVQEPDPRLGAAVAAAEGGDGIDGERSSAGICICSRHMHM